ncbi:hypothetical protein Pint_03218 [Pistacia integerrima]|uniref:Uncharacterized protein n=1 Tax=Pistacia integerrima TaxID=434235 RepID=A0ACC0ZLR5_9ROSI|nr:hypothetical protein Pint_03218 [Pistacia integerrima]
MSDTQEVISLPRSVFDETEEFSDTGSSNEVVSTLNHDNKNEEQVATQERRWIGTIVTKIFDGHTVMGEVIAYDEEIRKFKIVYEDDKREKVCEDELLSLAAPPQMVREYLDHVELNRSNEKKKKKKGTSKATKTSSQTSSLKIRIPINSNQPKAKEEVKGKRTRKAAQNPSTYIPLAIRENKRDAYIWYY